MCNWAVIIGLGVTKRQPASSNWPCSRVKACTAGCTEAHLPTSTVGWRGDPRGCGPGARRAVSHLEGAPHGGLTPVGLRAPTQIAMGAPWFLLQGMAAIAGSSSAALWLDRRTVARARAFRGSGSCHLGWQRPACPLRVPASAQTSAGPGAPRKPPFRDQDTPTEPRGRAVRRVSPPRDASDVMCCDVRKPNRKCTTRSNTGSASTTALSTLQIRGQTARFPCNQTAR